MQNDLFCKGCGVGLQDNDPNKSGYTKDLKMDYCLSCFKLINYGKNDTHVHPIDHFPIKDNSLIFVMQSVMQLDLLFTQAIIRLQPNARYVYLINQIDLLPKDFNIDFFMERILEKAKELKIKYEDIIMMSAINDADIYNLKNYILSQDLKDIYFYGFQNSGKTTVFKKLTNNLKAINLNKSGLTQDIIIDKLEDKTLYDMPGTYIKGILADYLPYEKYKEMLPSKRFKPKTFQLKENQAIIINDFIKISFEKTKELNLTIYTNLYNTFKKVNVVKNNYPLIETLMYEEKGITLKNKKQQIIIADFLFLQVNSSATIKVKLPKKMHISVMESYLK